MLEDSLVLAYRRRLDLESSNAPVVMAADAARDGGALVARLQATKEALMNSPLVRAAFPRAKGPERAKSRRLHLGGKDG